MIKTIFRFLLAFLAILIVGQAWSSVIAFHDDGHQYDINSVDLGTQHYDYDAVTKFRSNGVRLLPESASRKIQGGSFFTSVDGFFVVAKGASEGIGFTRSQLQHGFKHAEDFGIAGNANNKTLAEFSSAIDQHVNAAGTQAIQGTYRGQSVTHFVDPSSGLNVMRDASGNFLSGWKLSPQQLARARGQTRLIR